MREIEAESNILVWLENGEDDALNINALEIGYEFVASTLSDTTYRI